jgi:aminotransferase
VTPVRIPSRAARIVPAQFDVLNSRAAALRAEGHDVISLGQAVPAFGPPAEAVDAAREALGRAATHIYSSDAGHASLRQALCQQLEATQGVHVTPDEVIITAGGNQAFMLALMTCVDPGDEVLLPSPYFVNHQMAVAAFGAEPREVPLRETRGFAVRWQDLEASITNCTRAVVVCSPSNPTGAVAAHDEMARIAGELAARDVVLLCDETYARFVYDGEFTSLAAVPTWRDNGLVVSTFSKSFGMTGWRIGYLLASRRVCDAAIRIQDAMIICAPVISQIAVEAAVRERWDYPSAFMPELMAKRQLVADELARIPRLEWTQTAGGFFAFVHVQDCTDSATLASELLERAHVVTIPGSTFGRAGEGFIRLSYSAVPLAELRVALVRLREFFSG